MVKKVNLKKIKGDLHGFRIPWGTAESYGFLDVPDPNEDGLSYVFDVCAAGEFGAV